MARGKLNSVLIVENESGDVFIVEKNHADNFEERNIKSQLKSKNLKREPSFNSNDDEEEEEEEMIISQKNESRNKNLFCRYCDQKFKDKREMWVHFCMQLKMDNNNFICRFCNFEYDKKMFDHHMNEHNKSTKRNTENDVDDHETRSEKKPYNCLLRRKGVRTKIKYQRKKQRFECDLCGKYLSTLRSLNFHINLHRGDSSYICHSCGEPFFTPNGIKGHSCEKKRKRPATDFRTYDLRHCRFCDKNFSSYDENKLHSCEFQHPDNPKFVNCRCCGKILNKLAFNRHMESHSGIDWVCNVCNKKLATERALKTHMTTHTGNRPYKCLECHDTFINKVVLGRHMRFHGQSSKTWACDICFKILSTETSLKSHIQRLHKNTVQCELCKLEFENRDFLKDHITLSHEPSICKICLKSFSLPRYLKMHEKLHFDDDSSKVGCSFCSKQLKAKNIKHHVYRHHLDRFDEWKIENPSY